ncbi:MAG: hypothetical protein H6710_04985 [Myxococcales bacterium]|nr:hypothetical protein [Myxococcales bacterium]MCB9705593.1 hypothetical protein [Myxococcales bacterium]
MRQVQPSTLVAALALLAPSVAAAAEPFYSPPGELVAGSGEGRKDEKVYSPGMRFPIENGPAYPGSQVYGIGGYYGPKGSQCDPGNFSYPWHDNYCEKRSWDMPLCPAGIGHQGQDIRASTCEKGVHWTVVAHDGTVTNIPESPDEYATYINGKDGIRYDYLHGEQTAVKLGQAVAMGAHVDKVSNHFGGTATSLHSHFNLKMDVAGYGFVYVPPYMSLVESYKILMGLGGKPPQGALEEASCEVLLGWAQDPDEPEMSIKAALYFDGLPSDPENVGVEVTADLYRDDLCEPLGSCAHGFAVEMPMSLRDDLDHTLHVFAADDGNGPAEEIDASPASFRCPPPPLPEGVRRLIPTPEVIAAWKLSTFWDLAKPGDAAIAVIPVGEDLAMQPILARADDGSTEVWLVDGEHRRAIPSAEVAGRWGLDLEAAELWPAATVDALAEGPPLRDAPFMVKGSGPWIYLIDDPFCDDGDQSALCGALPGGTGTGTGGQDSDGSSASASASGSGGTSGDGDTSAGSSGGTGAGMPALPPGFGSVDEGGCGCRSAGDGDGGAALLLVPVLLTLRRRRR